MVERVSGLCREDFDLKNETLWLKRSQPDFWTGTQILAFLSGSATPTSQDRADGWSEPSTIPVDAAVGFGL
jgi:hypothetical protein